MKAIHCLKKFNISTIIFIIILSLLFLLTSINILKAILFSNINIQSTISETETQSAEPDGLKMQINNIEAKFEDHLFFKNYFAAIDINTKYILTDTIESKQVLLGKDNWLFYKTVTDGDTISDYMGTNLLSEDKMAEIVQHLTEMNDRLSEMGIKLAIIFPPNKEQIYFNFMPDTIERANGQSKTDALIDYLKANTDIAIVNPKSELIALNKEFQTYYKYDSHWNYLGGYIGVQQLLDELYQQRGYLQTSQLVESDDHYDLLNMLMMHWKFDKEISYAIKGYNYDSAYNELIVGNINANAVHDETVLFIGDSFRMSMIPYLMDSFENTTIIHRNDYTYQMIEKNKPSVIILEFVERYSNRLAYFELFP